MSRSPSLVALLALLCSCSAEVPPQALGTVVEACPGGEVRPVCRLQKDMCVTPYPDAGKACSDSSECAGDCLLDLTVRCETVGNCSTQILPESGTRASGKCEVDNDPCGSRFEVVNGVVQAPVHVD
jgi:hypothetical protein